MKMKHLLNLLLLLTVSASYAQLHISSDTELYVAGDAAFYSNEDVINEGTLTFKLATEVNFTLDAGLDNSAGSIAFEDATLVIGSGTTNADSTDDFTFGANDEVKHVVLDKSSGTTNVIGGHLGISETLKLTSGTLTAGDKITLLNPSVGQEAYVVESTGGTANLSVEKFYPAKRAFRMVASPVDGGSIFDNWQNGGLNQGDTGFETGIGTHITGSETGDNGFDVTETGNPSLFGFSTTNGWEAVTDTDNTNLEAGVPYRLMVRGDRSIDLTDKDATPNTTTLISTGDLQVGSTNISFPSATSGSNTFAFVANPYQSRIDVSKVLTANNSKADATRLWVWDPMINDRGAFVTIDELSGIGDTTPSSDATKFIEPGQAFFIQLSSADSEISFTENVKDVSTSIPTLQVLGNNQMSMLLDLRNDKGQIIDGIRFRFAADGSSKVDAADIAKMGNIDENLASVNENSLFAIQRRSFPENEEEIPLFTNNWRNKNYSFVANLNNLDEMNIYLVDAYLGTETLLNDGEAYSFSVDASVAASVDTSRFSLKFGNETMSVEDIENNLISLYPNPAQEVVNIQTNLALGTQVEVEIYNLLGQQVYASQQELKSSNLKVDVNTLNSGVYMVKLTDEAGRQHSHKLIKN